MSDTANGELFTKVVQRLCSYYNLVEEHPYQDSYLEISTVTGETICEMNPSGHCLLYNLKTLCDQLTTKGGLLL